MSEVDIRQSAASEWQQERARGEADPLHWANWSTGNLEFMVYDTVGKPCMTRGMKARLSLSPLSLSLSTK